jgi:hypothetical protein
MAKYQEIALRSGETIRLTEKELLFCNYYLGECNRNGTQAAIRAGYSEKTANRLASQTLSNIDIQKYLADRTAPVLEAMGATVDRVLQEWAELALSRPGQDITKDSPIPLGYQESKNFKTLTIEGMEVDQVEKTVSFNYSPKIKALAVVSEYLGIINKKAPDQPQQPQQVNYHFQQINNHIGGK